MKKIEGYKIDEDALEAAIETYKLEKMLDPDENALALALKAGFVVIQQRTIEQIADSMEELAAHILGEEIPSLEGAAVLEIFARDLREQIPRVDQQYKPVDDDIVQITLSGEVTVFENECADCGSKVDGTTWSILDRATCLEYFFDTRETTGLRVRVISPAGIDELLP
jgi:hypothetical protein